MVSQNNYGGPFTTEQVEDVKTILCLLVISLPISLIAFSSGTGGHIVTIGASGEAFPGLKIISCPLRVIFHFIYIPSLYSILGTIGQEFLLYPFIRSRIPTIFKFMCAQLVPYEMRGLLPSLLITLILASLGLGWIVSYAIKYKVCIQPRCVLIPLSVKTVLCFIGFLLFCVVVRWYKKRVRDEDHSPQRVVEEVYDRYLIAAAAQSRLCGAHS